MIIQLGASFCAKKLSDRDQGKMSGIGKEKDDLNIRKEKTQRL